MARYYEQYEGDDFELNYSDQQWETSRDNQGRIWARDKNMKLQNRFYVAADRIIDGNPHSTWRKPTIEAAIQHATELMEREGTDVKYIVQIVRVVKRKKMPIQVEVVK